MLRRCAFYYACSITVFIMFHFLILRVTGFVNFSFFCVGPILFSQVLYKEIFNNLSLLHFLMNYSYNCKFRKFCKGFIFAKLSRCGVS